METIFNNPTIYQQAFRNDGYVALKGFLNEEEVKDLQKNLERFFREVLPGMPDQHVFYEEKGNKNTLKQLQQLFTYDPYFHQLMFGSKFEKVAEILLEDKVVGKNMQYFNKPPQIGQPTPPHQDGYYFMLEPSEAVTMWLALEEVDEENGCVRYVKGSHNRGYRPHGRTQTLGFSQGITNYGTKEDLLEEIAFPAQPGDLLVHHAMTIHRAEGNTSTSRNRQALGFIYYAEKAKEDKSQHEAYQRQLQEEMKEKMGK